MDIELCWVMQTFSSSKIHTTDPIFAYQSREKQSPNYCGRGPVAESHNFNS